ncbi:hypothetical protein [Flavihumibacter profundi]|uniref:hypothetical protein n=1 Tax=Flavihumibacter profundi TaxID=2716883 RepID=UPI001CC69E5B|nr:hypothetical protein [Flavihumibacter profundi]MBZ5859483.1 hypothetical protein [Flavihumibacter profundi]
MKNGLFCLLFFFGGLAIAHAQQDTTYKSFLGKYKFPDGSVVQSVEVVGDSLNALSMNSEAGNSPLQHLDGDNFTIINFNGIANFKRADSTRAVVGIHIEAMGYILDGQKDNGTATWTWSISCSGEPLYAGRQFRRN